MRTTYCQRCGTAVYLGQSTGGEVLIDQGPPRENRQLIKVTPTDGTPAVIHSIHICKQVLYPRKTNTAAINAARRVVGLEPLQERGDGA